MTDAGVDTAADAGTAADADTVTDAASETDADTGPDTDTDAASDTDTVPDSAPDTAPDTALDPGPGPDCPTEWNPKPGEVPWGGPCPAAGMWTCFGNQSRARCEDPDGDGCPSWSPPIACPGNPFICQGGQCLCSPKCQNKVCGGDDCGGSCGTCTGGLICMGGQCVDLESIPPGTVLWEKKTGYGDFSAVAVAGDGTIYVSASIGVVHALSADGSVKWTLDTDVGIGGWYCSPGVAPIIDDEGNLLVGCVGSNPGLMKISPQGRVLWFFPTLGHVLESGALGYGGEVYFCAGKDLWAVSSAGEELWSAPGACDRNVSSVAPDGVIWLNRGRLDPSNGSELDAPEDVQFSFQYAFANGKSVAAVEDGNGDWGFSFFDQQGQLVWRAPSDVPVSRPILLASGRAYSLRLDAGIMWSDLTSGSSGVFPSPATIGINTMGVAVGDDDVLYGTAIIDIKNWVTYAMDSTGELLWTVADGTGNLQFALPQVGVMSATNARVMAVRTSSGPRSDGSWFTIRARPENSSRAP